MDKLSLYSLPKDILIKLVCEIQEQTEKRTRVLVKCENLWKPFCETFKPEIYEKGRKIIVCLLEEKVELVIFPGANGGPVIFFDYDGKGTIIELTDDGIIDLEIDEEDIFDTNDIDLFLEELKELFKN